MAYSQEDEDKTKTKPFITANPQAIPPTSGAPQVSQGNVTPLNQQYQVMKGLMGARQSNAATNPLNNNIARAGNTGVNTANQEISDYKKANTQTTQTPEQIQADYEAFKLDPNSPGGVKYSQSLAGGTVANAPQFVQSNNFVNTAQVANPTLHGGSMGNRILDQALISPAQQRMTAMLTGTANQNIGNARGAVNPEALQTATTANNQTVANQQQQAALNLKYVDDDKVYKAQAETAAKAAADAYQAKLATEKQQQEDEDLRNAAYGDGSQYTTANEALKTQLSSGKAKAKKSAFNDLMK